jgi:hypothetical protein
VKVLGADANVVGMRRAMVTHRSADVLKVVQALRQKDNSPGAKDLQYFIDEVNRRSAVASAIASIAPGKASGSSVGST